MFSVRDNKKYTVRDIVHHTRGEKEKWENDVFAELNIRMKQCPVSGCPLGYIYSQEQKDTHLLYGLEDGKPTRFYIDRKRYECQKCERTFFADYGQEDFGSNEHTLPEFIKYLIKEWLENKNESFYSIGKWYSFSRQTISEWCNMLISAFDEKTQCAAGNTMVFSSFHIKENNTIKTRAVVFKFLKNKYRVCAFLDDYDKLNSKSLYNALKERFTGLRSIKTIIYDYFPGTNIAMQGLFDNSAELMIDGDRLYENLKTMVKITDKTDREELDRIFDPKNANSPEERADNLEEWCESLKPDSVHCMVHDYLDLLFSKTRKHLINTFQYGNKYAYAYMNEITDYCEKRSGKKEPFASIKLRVLYDNREYKEKIEEQLNKLEINSSSGNKRNNKRKDPNVSRFITTFDIVEDSFGRTHRIESVFISDPIPAARQTDKNNEEIYNEEINNYSRPEFIEHFEYIDPNVVFEKMPKIRNWSVDVSRLGAAFNDERDEWLELDD